MYNNDAHNNYLWWYGTTNQNLGRTTFEGMYGLGTGDKRDAVDQPTQQYNDGHYHYNGTGDINTRINEGPAYYDIYYQNVAWALPSTDDWNQDGTHRLSSVINWPTKGAFMGIWSASSSMVTVLGPRNRTGRYDELRTRLPRYYDAQGSPMHLADICRQILIERHGEEYGSVDNFGNEPGAMALIHGLNDQGHSVFMHGNQSLQMSDATNELGTSSSTFDKINALTLRDLRFYMRAGENMSYRPHLTTAAIAYNISGLYQDFQFSPTGNIYGDEGSWFTGSWTSTHSDAFTAAKTEDSDGVGFYLDGSGETDGSPTGDYWNVDRAMTNTLNAAKTYEIWLKPTREGRQSLFFGAGTIQHVEIYPGSLTFRTEATTQNGYSFGASYNTGVDLDEFALVDGRDATNGFEVNKWNCLTITFNCEHFGGDGAVKWYCNGYHFHTGNMYSGSSGVGEYFEFASIGRATGSSSYLYAKSFQGYFDEFKIYDSVLNQTQIENNVRSSRHFADFYNGSDKQY
jgi:hypothetical protein